MDSRVRLALQVAGAVVLVAALVVVGGYTYFALTFGSADHTQFTLTVEPISEDRIAENATADLTSRAAAVVDTVHRNGSARTVAEQLDIDGAYVERNGTYYRVTVTEGPAVTRERPVVTIEQVDAGGNEVVAASDLPAADRDAFLLTWRAWTVQQEEGGDGPPARYVYEIVPDAADSVFVPDQEVRYVQRENRTFRVRVRNESVELDTTEYRLEPVAANESAFVDALVRNVTGRLNDSEAEPLERAIENGTYVSRAGTYAEAERPIRPVADALGMSDPADLMYAADDEGYVRYVRYEGRYYRVTLTGYTTAA